MLFFQDKLVLTKYNGNGNSLNLDNNKVVTKHEIGMHKFEPKTDEDNTVYVFIPNSHFIQNLETATCKEQYLY